MTYLKQFSPRLAIWIGMLMMLVVAGLATTPACGGGSQPPECVPAPTPAPVATGYQSVTLFKELDEKKEYSLSVKNIRGIKVEGGDVHQPANNGWFHSPRLILLVALEEPTDATVVSTAAKPIKFLKLIGTPREFVVLTDVPTDQASWLHGQVFCGGNIGFDCNAGTYRIAHLTIHLHSLDELH